MWARALWGREYAQARLFVWGVPVVHFLTLGMLRMNRWLFSDQASVDATLRWIEQSEEPFKQAYDYGAFETAGRFWLLLAAFVLALVQLGTERKNGSQELLFALPYSRRQIFVHKWLLGAALLTGTLLLNAVIDMAVVLAAPIAKYFSLTYHLKELGYSWIALVALYTLFLFIGSITGSVASQTAISVVIWALPAGLTYLIVNSLRIQGFSVERPLLYGDLSGPAWYDRLQEHLNLSNYISLDSDQLSWAKAGALFALFAVSAVGGLLAYERNPAENNGKMMVFPVWERVLRVGFVLSASLLAGMLGSSFFGFHQRVGYDIGLLAGLALSALIIRKLTSIRLKI